MLPQAKNRIGKTTTFLLALAGLLIALGQSARAAQQFTLAGWQVPLRAGHASQIARVARQVARVTAAQPAVIEVSYHGFSPQAQAAFQYAVDIWRAQISSPVPIQIDATWQPLDPDDLLGSAGTADFVRDFPHAPVANTWYPIGLANKLAGQDLAPASPDIYANFNSDRDDWYFGTDGQTPLNEFDFATTVLHELGHGLGLIGSMNVFDEQSQAQGYWGVFNGPFTGAPIIFDRFAVNQSGQQLIDTSLFPNPSAALAAQLTGGNLFFDGPNTRAANAGAAARLYTPNEWQNGSSFTHLDENSYGAGDPNSLMTPFLNNGESIHDPGPLIRGMFADLGWAVALDTPISGLSIGNNGPTNLGNPTTLTAAIAAGTNVDYVWSFGDGAAGAGATVSHEYTSAGSYTATVTATNTHGLATATTSVQVIAATASTTITPAGGSLTTPDSSVQISFPPTALASTSSVTYTALSAPDHALPAGARVLRSFSIAVRANTGKPVTSFDPPVTIVIAYTQADLAQGRLDEQTIDALFWNGSAWVQILPCAGCSVNAATNRVTLVLDHLSQFAIIGQPQPAIYLPLVQIEN